MGGPTNGPHDHGTGPEAPGRFALGVLGLLAVISTIASAGDAFVVRDDLGDLADLAPDTREVVSEP